MICIEPDELSQMFPPGRTGIERPKTHGPSPKIREEEEEDAMLQAITSEIKPIRPIPTQNISEDANVAAGNEKDDEIPRPGSFYKRYKKASQLPDKAKIFYQVVADLVGVSLDILVRAVFLSEVRLNDWQVSVVRMKRRIAAAASEQEVEGEIDVGMEIPGDDKEVLFDEEDKVDRMDIDEEDENDGLDDDI